MDWFQVLWLGEEVCKATWESEENIPQSVVREFEQGTVSHVTDLASSHGMGKTVHTLTVSNQTQPTSSAHEPPDHRPVLAESDGCVKHYMYNFVVAATPVYMYVCFWFRVFATNSDDDSVHLECNTEKDKERLHHRTAGSSMYIHV